MTITDRAVNKIIYWTVETENDTYYVQCQEDDIYDTWFINSDEEGSIDVKSELGKKLREMCEIDMEQQQM